MRKSTIFYILLFIVLAGVYYYLNNREEPATDIAITLEPETEVSYLFGFENGTPTGIRVESKAGETVEVTLDADNTWVLTLPTEAAANQDSVSAAAGQVTIIQITDRLPDISPQDVGLDDPEYTLTVKFTDGVERNVEVGVITPTESGYYARMDGGEIVIVSKYAMDALLDLLISPPYMPTETPLPPTPEAVAP